MYRNRYYGHNTETDDDDDGAYDDYGGETEY